MIGLDTNAIIESFRKNPEFIKLIESLNEDISSTIINYQEIMFGIDSENKRYGDEKKFFDSFFNDINLFLIDKDSCVKSTEILWGLRKKGIDIGKWDCMIAGIFLANGVNKIITRNKKHFENIPGLKVISY
jgi:predicted nucleic acid-binding protein